ncbi:unnamed protein product [Ceratitis capitata]|uniref:(Mediterranean fruit fly) hypothetical protein n=1 Tax=Ceratitis capitata TaxID=7213 RepID=A0A811U8D8_CERCA|nr:unnamed protein product [Ceratitis capitata]
MEKDHPYYDAIVNDERYVNGPTKKEFPMFESLKLTIDRTLPYWNDTIVPQITEGKLILISAHGNSLRGIVKHLDSKKYNSSSLRNENINCINAFRFIRRSNYGAKFTNWNTIIYELDECLKPVVSMKFLGDEDTVRKAMDAVAAQGKAK